MPIGEWIATFFTSAGPGGAVVITVIGLAAAVYVWLMRWILRGGEQAEEEKYRFK